MHRYVMQPLREIKLRYVKKCLDFNIYLILLFGGWPLVKDERNIFLRLVRIVPYLILFGCVVMIICLLLAIPSKLGDYPLLSEIIIILISVLKAIARLRIVIFQFRILVETTNQLDRFVENLNKDEELIFQDYKRKSQRFTLMFVGITFLFGLVFSIEPLFDKSRRFPGHFEFPFNAILSPVYELIYVLTFLMGAGISIVESLGSVFIISCMIYTTGFFKLLQDKLKNVRNSAVNKLSARNADNLDIAVPTLNTVQNDVTTCLIEELEGVHEPKIMYSRIDNANLITPQICTSVNVNVPSLKNPSDSQGTVLDVPKRRMIKLKRFKNIVRTCKNMEIRGAGTRESNLEVNKRILSNSLRSLCKERPFKRLAQKEAMERNLVTCVEFHVKLLRFVVDFQERFRIMLFLDISVGGVMICIVLFQLGGIRSFSSQLAVWLGYLGLIIWQLFSYCWVCSDVAKESTLVSDAMYFTDWLRASKSYKRSMQIIMSRSVQPVQLGAASFLPFTMEMFTNLLNSGYSYFNMVTKIHEGK